MSQYLSGFFEGDDEAFVTALLVEVRTPTGSPSSRAAIHRRC